MATDKGHGFMESSMLRSTNDPIVKRFFEKLSDAMGIYVCSYDYCGKLINDFTGNETEIEILDEIVSGELRHQMFQRLTLDSIEDQIVEDTVNPYVKAAAVALKFQGVCKEVWFFAGVLRPDEDDTSLPEKVQGLSKFTTEHRFNCAIDACREMGRYRVGAELSLNQYEEESRKSLFSVNEMSESLRQVETLTRILKYLDSDKNYEVIMHDFLEITAGYLGVGQASIFKINEENDFSMEVMSNYTIQGETAPFDRTKGLIKLPFLEGRKPIILSAGSVALDHIGKLWPRMECKACVAMPISIGQVTDLFAVYFETNFERNWKIEELQFLSDAIRVLQNVLDKRRQKNSLLTSFASLEEILEHVGCAICVCDHAKHKMLFKNKQMHEFFPDNKMDAELYGIIWEPKADMRNIVDYYDYDSGRWFEIHYSQISWVDGSRVALYAIYDVTEKKNYQNRIEQQAYTDYLTGLLNRMCCERDLARIIDEAKKRQQTGALLYLDLDDFKHINDGLGHQYGDILLKEISAAIHSIKGIEETCYRMGGDEFVIIVPPRSYRFFNEILDNIKGVFVRPWFLKDGEYYCTMSMGMVTFPDEGDNVEDLIKKADIAMYSAKKTGKNRVAKYNSESLSESNKRLDMEKNMRDAIGMGFDEFLIYYQPIIDISKPKAPCVGAEALIRWDSKELGFISPTDFIPLAEYLGLINPIGNYVLKKACEECKKWNDNGHPEFKVNVNLSVVQLMQDNIVEIVKDTVKETGITPGNLTLEVTESLAINDMERMKGIMTEIRSLGVRIALDDFGTGYSSLNHIREIPLDVIKVDQSFIRELEEDDYSKSFIKMVAELAGAIGVSICVEGVETAAQYKILRGMKVLIAQGFYFDKPIPKDEFERKYVLPSRQKE